MVYESITNQLLELISNATHIILLIDKSNGNDDLEMITQKQNDWLNECQKVLIKNELFLEQEEFINYQPSIGKITNLTNQLNPIMKFMKNRKQLLIEFAKNIELKQNKKVIFLKIDDFDNFKEITKIKSSDVLDYAKDCFLEDDVEEAFLDKLEEPYKEFDGGAETRDLFTDRLRYNSKRLSTVFMFKGRGKKGELTIKKSGSTGNQLLKVAKNNSAECFIVQHINKISTDVREALQEHVLQNTRLSKVYICFIDGVDTARFLKSIGKDLKELKNKKWAH